MLALVVADGNLVGVVDQDVGGHQDRVVEQPGAHRLLTLGLLLELRHAAQLTERGHAIEDPRALGVRSDVTLYEDECALGVEAGGEEQRGDLAGPGPQIGGVVGHRHRVEVDHAVDGIVAGRRG